MYSHVRLPSFLPFILPIERTFVFPCLGPSHSSSREGVFKSDFRRLSNEGAKNSFSVHLSLFFCFAYRVRRRGWDVLREQHVYYL